MFASGRPMPRDDMEYVFHSSRISSAYIFNETARFAIDAGGPFWKFRDRDLSVNRFALTEQIRRKGLLSFVSSKQGRGIALSFPSSDRDADFIWIT
jgi:hypothetical protein